MKSVLALFACSIAATLALGATPPVATQPPSPELSLAGDAPRSTTAVGCPPTVYECCDGTISAACSSHGGKCGIISICGVPY